MRTLQRQVKTWRALSGPAKEIYFPPKYHPGRLAASDFTHMSKLGVTIQSQPFPHLAATQIPPPELTWAPPWRAVFRRDVAFAPHHFEGAKSERLEVSSPVQVITDDWLKDYKTERPHDSLGRVPPLTFLPGELASGYTLWNCPPDGEAHAYTSPTLPMLKGSVLL